MYINIYMLPSCLTVKPRVWWRVENWKIDNPLAKSRKRGSMVEEMSLTNTWNKLEFTCHVLYDAITAYYYDCVIIEGFWIYKVLSLHDIVDDDFLIYFSFPWWLKVWLLFTGLAFNSAALKIILNKKGYRYPRKT